MSSRLHSEHANWSDVTELHLPKDTNGYGTVYHCEENKETGEPEKAGQTMNPRARKGDKENFFPLIYINNGCLDKDQQLLAQLLEVGLQSLLGLSCPMECMAFDCIVFERQKEWIHAAADRICSELEDNKYDKKSVLTCWPPARDSEKELLTKPIVTEAIGFAKNESSNEFKR